MNLKVEEKNWGLQVSIDTGDVLISQDVISLSEKVELQEALIEALDAVSANINEELRGKGVI